MTVQPPIPVLPEIYASLTKAQRHILRNPKIPGVQLAAHETAGDKGPTSQKRTLVAPVQGLKDHPFAQEDGTASVLENFMPTLTGVEIRPGVKRLVPVAQETTNSQLIEHSRADEPPGVSPMIAFLDPEEDNTDVVYVMGGNSVVLSVEEPEPPEVHYEIDGGLKLAARFTSQFFTNTSGLMRLSGFGIRSITDLDGSNSRSRPFSRPANFPDIRFAIGVNDADGSNREILASYQVDWPLTGDPISVADLNHADAHTNNKIGFVEFQQRIGGEWISDDAGRFERPFDGGTERNTDIFLYRFEFDEDRPTAEMPEDGLKVTVRFDTIFRRGSSGTMIWSGPRILSVTDVDGTNARSFPLARPQNAPSMRLILGVNDSDGSNRKVIAVYNIGWPLIIDPIHLADRAEPGASTSSKVGFIELQQRVNGEWTADNAGRYERNFDSSTERNDDVVLNIFGVIRGGAEPILFLDESPLSDPECVSIAVFDGADTTYAILVDGSNFPRRYDSTTRFKHIPDVIAGDDESDEDLTPAIGTLDNIGVDDGLNIETRIGLNLVNDTISIISNRSNIVEVTDINGANPREFPVEQPANAPNVRLIFGYRESDSDPKVVTTTVELEWPLPNDPIMFDDDAVSGAEAGGWKAFVELQQFENGAWASDPNGRAEFDFGGSHDATLFLRASFPDNSSRAFYYQKGGKGQNADNIGQLITDDDDKVASNLDIRPQDFSYVFAFKSRLFFVEKNSTNAWYLGVLNVSGPVSKLPLGGVLPFNSSILFGLAWTTQWGDELADRAIFVTSEGHVAAYHGTPGLDNFELQGVYRIAPPLGKHAHFQYGGDAYILTGDGVVSLNAVVQGQALGSGSPFITDPIRTLWRALARERKASCHWRCSVWPSRGLAFVFNNDPEFNETLMFGVNLFQFTWFNVKFNKLLAAQMPNGGERDHLVAGLATIGDQCYLVDSWGNLYTFGAGRDEYFYYVEPADAENVQPTEGDKTTEVQIDAIACMTPINHGSNVRATDMRTLWRGDPIEDVKSLLPPVLPGELEKENIRPWPVPKSAEDSRANPRRWSRVPRRITKAQEEFASPTVQVAVERELEPTSELTHIEYRVTDAGT